MNPLKLHLFLCLALLPAVTHAGTRTSTSYTISTDTADFGGVRTTSSSYTNDGGVEVVSGVSSVTSPAETGRTGYVGQLTELATFVVSSPASSFPQNTSIQLAGTATLDDGTTSALSGTDIAWSAALYPFSSITAAGLLTAGSVYAAPSGTETGTYLGTSGSVTLQVTGGPYVGGGIPDSWLVQYFGLPPNPAAAPGFDADGTGQSNLLKYLAGLNPLDGSRFVLTVSPVPNQASQKNLTLTPVYSGRTYTVQTNADLLAANSWQTLTNTSTSDSGTIRTVIDLSASDSRRFYRVLISMP